jgi:hypothetical protein
MGHSLLFAVVIVFCCTVGYGLSAQHGSAWVLMVLNIAAIVSLQLSYMVGAFTHAGG